MVVNIHFDTCHESDSNSSNPSPNNNSLQFSDNNGAVFGWAERTPLIFELWPRNSFVPNSYLGNWNVD